MKILATTNCEYEGDEDWPSWYALSEHVPCRQLICAHNHLFELPLPRLAIVTKVYDRSGTDRSDTDSERVYAPYVRAVVALVGPSTGPDTPVYLTPLAHQYHWGEMCPSSPEDDDRLTDDWDVYALLDRYPTFTPRQAVTWATGIFWAEHWYHDDDYNPAHRALDRLVDYRGFTARHRYWEAQSLVWATGLGWGRFPITASNNKIMSASASTLGYWRELWTPERTWQ